MVVVWIWKRKKDWKKRDKLLSCEIDWWVWIMREMSASNTPHVKWENFFHFFNSFFFRRFGPSVCEQTVITYGRFRPLVSLWRLRPPLSYKSVQKWYFLMFWRFFLTYWRLRPSQTYWGLKPPVNVN
jgi:hypothetical protein